MEDTGNKYMDELLVDVDIEIPEEYHGDYKKITEYLEITFLKHLESKKIADKISNKKTRVGFQFTD
jgi:hypothetical protein